VLLELEGVMNMEVPKGAAASTVSAIVNARLDAAATVAWLRPALFPEDDDG
jgi:hypothetical protein